MDDNRQLQEVLQQIQENSRKQTRYARLQCLFSLVAVLCCAALLVVAIGMIPQVEQALEEVDILAVQAKTLAGQAQTVLGNLETVTEELAEADFSTMVQNMDDLVLTSQEGVSKALEKMEAMDIEALNKAVANLAAVVEPMAKFFKVFQ